MFFRRVKGGHARLGAVLTRPVCDVLPASTTRFLRAPLKTSGPVSVGDVLFFRWGNSSRPRHVLVTSPPPIEEDVTSLPIAS